MFIHITYGRSRWFLKAVDIYNFIKYRILRPIISNVSFYCYYIFFYRRYEKTFEGNPLKPGISAYIPCKNEAAHLMLCLKSLLPVVDHFILIDNGSEDNTLDLMYEFQKSHQHEASIEVITMAKALLVEMVQAALTRVKHKWVLKWDGDMIAITENLKAMKKRITNISRPTAYTLPRINLWGDFFHVSTWMPVLDGGEYFLRTFNNRFFFKEEYGRLEHAIIPIYYTLKREIDVFYSFHLSNIRPPLRILYRHCYLDWRQTVNTGTDKNKYRSWEKFRNDWMQHNFGTNHEPSVKFRFSRLIASMVKREYHPVTEAMQQIIDEGKEPFKIIYRNDRPYLMMDKSDSDFKNYYPSDEDISWEPDYRRFYNDHIRLGFTKQDHEPNSR
ncbi:MAG: glycosyltransferase [Chitinophagales bacterium]|nr:glycosyltransferase [Chitinophagales bacterium]